MMPSNHPNDARRLLAGEAAYDASVSSKQTRSGSGSVPSSNLVFGRGGEMPLASEFTWQIELLAVGDDGSVRIGEGFPLLNGGGRHDH